MSRYSFSRSMAAMAVTRFRMYVPTPKSRNRRASMATFIWDRRRVAARRRRRGRLSRMRVLTSSGDRLLFPGVQRELVGQGPDAAADPVDGLFRADVIDDFGDQVGDLGHLGLLEASGGD